MAEHPLELRLEAVARTLDAHAPAFDPARLRATTRRTRPRQVVALVAAVILLAVAAAPTAVSALRHLFEVEEVPELGPIPSGVAPPFEGRLVDVERLDREAPFPVRRLDSLGAPDTAHVRDDVAGGMVSLGYEGGRIVLTQWRVDDVHARVAVVPVAGTAEDVSVGDVSGLWLAGAARGTFTLVGADGAVHREAFEVSPGALLWKRDGMAFFLRGAGSRDAAVRLAAGA
jgi:hypothetical protein